MGDPPTGTVTFLFTDIEGSTSLARTLGERWNGVLERHHAILRRAIRGHRGLDLRTQGDAFFAVFTSAVDAVAAAVAAQRELAGHPWPDDGPVRVRMGMHTGEGRLAGGDYVGLDVHRAARIAAAGHGGQVLLSEATEALVRQAAPAGVTVRDLGSHRLKDFDDPQRIHQLVIDGLDAEHPPLRTREIPSNLPPQLTSFVGRERELAEIEGLLRRTRLLVLVGPGGTGKTRLAIETGARQAEAHPDGVVFVDLSPLRDPELVPAALVRALGLRPRSGRPALQTAIEHLAERRSLVLLDNFEQVLPAAPTVEEILRAAPLVTVVVTSRAGLRLPAEQEYPVPPLPLPPVDADPAALERNEAASLFAARARAILPSFEVTAVNAAAIAEVCERLDGLPLAIELAAAQLRALSPAELLARLRRGLPLRSPMAGAVERQRTLRGAIDWSYRLLGEPERRLFARLSVFSGGATFAAAEAVGNPGGDLGVDTLDALDTLVGQSLVRRHESAEGSRFVMLETIREHAVERLRDDGDLEEAERRHADFFRSLAETWGPLVRSREIEAAVRAVEADLDNLRAAIGRAVRDDRAEDGFRLVAPLWMYWADRGNLSEARAAVESLLALPSGAAPSRERAGALNALAAIVYWQQDYARAASLYRESLGLFRGLGDHDGEAKARTDLAYSLLAQRDPAAAMPLIEENLAAARDGTDPAFAAEAVGLLGLALAMGGDYERALAASEESLRGLREIGGAVAIYVGEVEGRIGSILRMMGRLDEAERHIADGLRAARSSAGRLGALSVAEQLAAVAADGGDLERALRLAGFAAAALDLVQGGPPPALTLTPPPSTYRDRAAGALDAGRIEALWSEGAAMSVDEAIAFALRETP